jgi:ABC-type sugar transport system permease subunit
MSNVSPSALGSPNLRATTPGRTLPELVQAVPGYIINARVVTLVLALVMLAGFVTRFWFSPAEDVAFTGLELVLNAPTIPDGGFPLAALSRVAALVMGLSAAAASILALAAFVGGTVRRVAPVVIAALGVAGVVSGIVYLSDQAAAPILARTLDIGFWMTLLASIGLILQLCWRADLAFPRLRFPFLALVTILNFVTWALTLSAQVQRSRINESVAFEITALVGISLYGAFMGTLLSGYIFRKKGYNVWLGRVLGALLGAFGNLFLLVPLWVHLPYDETRDYKRIKLDEIIWGLAFLTPWLIGFILLNLHPMIDSWRVALYNWRGVGVPTQYVGLRHVETVINDQFFWLSFRNTVVYTAVLVPIQLTLSLLLALVLNRSRMRFATFYRTVYFLPVVTSVSVVAVVMRLILSNFGSSLSAALGVDPPVNPISSPQFALASVIMFGLWHSFGVNLVYFLAALQTVPQELYDAAKVDGANWWQEILNVTLPGIRPIAIVITFMAVIGSMNVFEQSFVLTRGGPFYASQVVTGYIYGYAFYTPNSMLTPNLGYASAAALFFSLIMLVLTALNYFVISRMRRNNA